MKLHRNVKIRLVFSFLQLGGSSLVIPFLAIYFAEHFGAGIAGVLFIVTVFGSIIFSFYGGYYSDRFGRKNILVFASLLRFLSILILVAGNIPGHEIPILAFVSLLFVNISVGFQMPPLEATVVDVTTSEVRKKVYNLSYWLANFSSIFGILLGAFLYEDYFFELSICAATVNLIMFLLMKFFLVETKPASKQKPPVKPAKFPLKNMFSSYGLVFKDSLFLKFVAAGLLTLGLEKQLGKFIAVRLEEDFEPVTVFGQSIQGVEVFGILNTENSILIVLFTLVIARLIKKFDLSDRMQLYIGTLLFAGGFAVLAFASNLWVLMAFTFLLSVGEIMYVPVKRLLLSEIAPNESRSRYMAANTLHTRGASVLGGLGLSVGFLLHSWGMAIVYALMGAVSIYLFKRIYDQKREVHQEKNDVRMNG
ncbi:MAG TPA: MFS transporter [Bacillales bacterium]|nr:MFS transporter [Bacillales bacterium]